MNLQIILAVILAVVIVVVAYRHLKWSAVIWLGGLFAVAATSALLLNFTNDGITWSIPVGDGLFRRGDSVSILGEYGWISTIGLVTGLVLMAAGVVKRIRMPAPGPVAPVESDPPRERERIREALVEEIQEVRDALGDPAERGQQDARAPGGVIPGRHTTEPQGFEVDARGRYEALGKSFVRETVTRLKVEIEEALQKLSTLKSTLAEKYYKEMASADYHENADEPDPEHVDKLNDKVTKAFQARAQFVENLNLAPGEHPDWSKPTLFLHLVIIGSVFAVIEFCVSYWFLKGPLGEGPAIENALYAMVIVFILGFLLAAIFQFLRRPHVAWKRMLAGLGFFASLFLLGCGFGLLLYARAEGVDFTAPESIRQLRIQNILTGYESLLSDLGNLTLFLINLFALVIFCWKTLLFFERFTGYRRVDGKLVQAKEEWDAMFRNNSACIKQALRKASTEAAENKKTATRAVRELQEKRDVLENIQAIIAQVFVLKLRPAYQDTVIAYRTSNSEHRGTVNPPPPYFQPMPPFCEVEQHFAGDHGIDEFLSRYQEDIDQASDTCQKVESRATDWNNERSQLNVELAAEFTRKINEAGQ